MKNKLVVGTAQFGMPYGIANQNGKVQNNEIEAILDLAWERGIDTLDTAKVYSHSEEVIGDYLRKHPNQPWTICTKISDGDSDLFHQFQDTVEKLSIHPTIILAHSASLYLEKSFHKDLKSLMEVKSISKIGVSLYTENEIKQILKSDFKPDIVQLPLNILDARLYHNNILKQLTQIGIEIHVRSVFLQGLFYLHFSEIKNRFSDALPYLEKLKSIAADSELTLAELSLLWVTSLSEVSKVIIGVDKTSHLITHLNTLGKQVSSSIFEEALAVIYNNENVLNPSLWAK